MGAEKTIEPVEGSPEVTDAGSLDGALFIEPDVEKKLLRKLDIFLAPVFTIIFLAAYLDRSNIGNAASAGMLDDLGMSSSELGSTRRIHEHTSKSHNMLTTLPQML